MAQIDIPNLHFRIKLYTGNGSARSITFDESGNMQPDLMWVKGRDTTASWLCNDAVRGATKRLKLDATDAESTQTGMITSFDTNGFSLGTTSTSNNNGSTYAAFNWKANGAGSSNGDGSITATVSANTTANFSICTYTGTGSNATFGHGLSVAPKMVIIKSRGGARSWPVFHENMGGGQAMFIDTTAQKDIDSSYWNSTIPSTSVVSIGSRSEMNHNGENFVAYCFGNKPGYSYIDAYTGNNNDDGPFIYCGFRPAWVLLKRKDGVEGWYLMDAKRDTHNLTSRNLFPASTSAENNMSNTNQVNMDILSNGFKIKSTDTAINASGGEYIFAAFAQNPIVGSNDVPAVAR
jgi:hypothetical protein